LLVLTIGSFEFLYLRGTSAWRLALQALCPSAPEKRFMTPVIAVSNDRRKLFCLGRDGQGHVFDVRTGSAKCDIVLPLAAKKPFGCSSPRFMNDDRCISVDCSYANGFMTLVFDSASGTLVSENKRVDIPAPDPSVSHFDGRACAPDGSRRTELVFPKDSIPDAWHLISDTGREIGVFPSGGGYFPRGAAFSADSRLLATAARDVRIRSAVDGRELAALIPPRPFSRAQAISFTPDSRYLLVTRLDDVLLYESQRPMAWWGAACLPQFWLPTFFSMTLIWSVWRDRKRP
jgi:hypothetical protein